MGTVSSIVVIFTKTSIELGSVSIIKIKSTGLCNSY